MGATSLSGRTRDESEWPARSARREAKSELAQVRAHHGFVPSDRTRACQLFCFEVSKSRLLIGSTFAYLKYRTRLPHASGNNCGNSTSTARTGKRSETSPFGVSEPR